MAAGDDERALGAAATLAAAHIRQRRSDRVVGQFDREAMAARIRGFSFDAALDADAVAQFLIQLLAETGVRSDHPRYYGFFNPPALAAAIAGDMIADVVNPQLAVWGHAPAAVEIERHLLNTIGKLIWSTDETAGSFTSGGSEANHTALLCALARRYPEWHRTGLQPLAVLPAIFVSAESHLAWIKIARAAGLGSVAVRLVTTRDGLNLDGETLRAAMRERPDLDPVLIVATAGTTAHGAIDDLAGIAAAARDHNAHFHVDAAWAGGALLSARHRHVLGGMELADSVTIDPHKWLAVPMGSGMYLARDWSALESAFGVSTGYMPSRSHEDRDPYIHSLQWSRRFNGAKLFMALATLGIDGYGAMIDRQFALGDRLRRGLAGAGFQIVNDTPLPLVCFEPSSGTEVQRIVEAVTGSGAAWIASVALRGRPCLRACITSFETTEADVDALIELVSGVC
jgi:glutamate/tyrosine decarboxylase-like PLP-dependent enzyme